MAFEEELAAWLGGRAEADEFSGVVLIRRGAETVFGGAYGRATRRWPVPNTMETRFDTASITKLFTAVAALQLVGEGRLSLDARITELVDLAGTTISRDVLVRHLLTHTSGIADDADEEAGEDYEALWVDKPVYSVIETRDFLPLFAYKPPIFAPGEGCRYCNVGFTLVGLAIEAVTGTPYKKHVTSAVFGPAGMAASGFFDRRDPAADVAEGWDPVTDESGARTGWKSNMYSYPPIGSPADGAQVTAGDLVTFGQAVRAGRLLSPEMTDAFLTPQVMHHARAGHEIWYGYGLEFVRAPDGTVRSQYKDGDNTGALGMSRYYPAAGLDVAMLSNSSVGGLDAIDAIHDAIQAEHPEVGDSGF